MLVVDAVSSVVSGGPVSGGAVVGGAVVVGLVLAVVCGPDSSRPGQRPPWLQHAPWAGCWQVPSGQVTNPAAHSSGPVLPLSPSWLGSSSWQPWPAAIPRPSATSTASRRWIFIVGLSSGN